MSVKSIDLSWIVVGDLKKAVKFYTEIVGLKLMELHEQYGWAELRGQDGGSKFGIAQANDKDGMKPGQNALPAFTVENIEATKKDLTSKGTKSSTIQEIPGHVKLMTVEDSDGNRFQFVELLS